MFVSVLVQRHARERLVFFAQLLDALVRSDEFADDLTDRQVLFMHLDEILKVLLRNLVEAAVRCSHQKEQCLIVNGFPDDLQAFSAVRHLLLVVADDVLKRLVKRSD